MNANPETEINAAPKTSSIRRNMIVGSLWMVALRFSMRGIGLISTVLLARILLPQDFGLVAMASIMVGLLDTLSSFGVDLALIQNVRATRRQFDTAWTIQVIQGAGVALLLVLTAPFAAWYFHEPRVAPLVRFLALGMAVGGFTNIGVVAFRKDLDFALEYRFSIYKKLLSFAITLGLALSLHSHWSLAAGIVVSQVFSVFLSYRMHPYRPRLSLEAVREMWSFSQWMLLANIGNYAYEKGDELVVGNLTSPRGLGLYAVAYEISNLPSTELVAPISRALFPGFAKLVTEPNRLARAYLNVLGFVTTCSIAAGLGIAATASDLSAILLGSRWEDAGPVIEWLALFGVLRAVFGQTGNILLALGHTRAIAAINWFQVILLIPSTIFAGIEFGIIGIAITKVSVAVVCAAMLLHRLIRNTSITVTDILRQIWRPGMAGAAMFVAVSAFDPSFVTVPLFSLILDAILGAIVYISTVLILWHLARRPEGTEKFVLQLILERYKNLRSR